MASSAKRTIALLVCVSAAAAFMAFMAVWTLWRWTARTDTVSVTAIDEGYEIRITSSGRSRLPLGPEGSFKEWSQETRFLAQGSGEQKKIDGLIYKKYTMGRDLETTWLSDMFSHCTVCISEEAKRLVVQGELSADKNYLINHSGTYDGITIDRPKFFPCLNMLRSKISTIATSGRRAMSRTGKLRRVGRRLPSTFGKRAITRLLVSSTRGEEPCPFC